MRSFARWAGLASAVLLLAACGATAKDSGISKEHRVSVLAPGQEKLAADPRAADFTIELSQPESNSAWPQAGRVASHAGGQVEMGEEIDEAWRASVGAASNGDYRLLAQPVIGGDRIFTMDAKGRLRAFDMEGSRLWHFDATPEGAEEPAMGGGLAFDAGLLYATTGFGEVLALKAETGQVVWRQNVGKPFRAPPAVADGRLYAVTIDNELHALSTKNGEEQWHHSGITENAALMGAAAPAVSGDHVVVAYSSGEIYDLHTQNGRVAWSDALTSAAKVGALPAISDIRGLPVIDGGLVFAVSHSGRMAAFDLRGGERVWEVDIGGVNSPAVSGNAVFVVSNEGQLAALSRETGRLIWIKDLPKQVDLDDPDSPLLLWMGPVVAGGRLWLTNSGGDIVSYAAANGAVESDFGAEDGPFYIPPFIVGKTVYVLTDKGHLMAFR